MVEICLEAGADINAADEVRELIFLVHSLSAAKRFILVAKSLFAYVMGPQSKHLILRKGFILRFEKCGTLQQLNKIKAQSL